MIIRLCAVDSCRVLGAPVNEFSASFSEKKCRFCSYFIPKKSHLVVISSTCLHKINESKHFCAFFAMCDGFNHGALQTAVAQICQSMGWDALQKSTHDLLTDVLQKYLEEIAKSAHGYSQLCKLKSFRSTFFV